MSRIYESDSQNTTASEKEVAQFEALADQWWDAKGDFAPLHKINPVRLAFIRDHLCAYFDRDFKQKRSLKNLSIIDIGCGGGLICEPLTRLGAQVTGIDAGEQNINVAKLHANQSSLDIIYRKLLPEDAVAERLSFDVVLNLEVIEHVVDPAAFMSACGTLVKPGGAIVCATLNRTLKSFALAKIGAEYILRWLPRGTHDWRTFLKPSELCTLLRREGFTISDLKGITYNLFFDEWSLTKDLAVNYLIFAKKPVFSHVRDNSDQLKPAN